MSYTNRKVHQAIAGQGVVVTLDATDSAALLPTLAVGTKATTEQNVGYVCRVDTLGNSFEVNPTVGFFIYAGRIGGISSNNNRIKIKYHDLSTIRFNR